MAEIEEMKEASDLDREVIVLPVDAKGKMVKAVVTQVAKVWDRFLMNYRNKDPAAIPLKNPPDK